MIDFCLGNLYSNIYILRNNVKYNSVMFVSTFITQSRISIILYVWCVQACCGYVGLLSGGGREVYEFSFNCQIYFLSHANVSLAYTQNNSRFVFSLTLNENGSLLSNISIIVMLIQMKGSERSHVCFYTFKVSGKLNFSWIFRKFSRLTLSYTDN